MLFEGRFFVTVSILPLLLVGSSCATQIDFASKDSALVIKDGSTLEVVSPQMKIVGGTLENTGFGNVVGQRVRFQRGRYTFFNSESDLNGVLEPNSNMIELGNNPSEDGDTMIANPGGLSGVQMTVRPGNNILRGQPLFFGSNDIFLEPGGPLLAMAVQNAVNTNLILNGGVLLLQDDLRLGDDSVILDNGIVAFNNRRLSLGGAAAEWNGTIIWDSALDLQLNSAVTLNGCWLFLGEGQINGNGNVIDIANGGKITVLAGSRLRLSGVQIKGLGSGTINLADDAELILTDVVIEMDDSYDFDSGTVIIEGDSKVITKDNILEFKDGPGGSIGKLIIDRVSLTYDPLSFIDNFNVRPQLILDPTRRHVDIIGDGEIGVARRDTATFTNYRPNTGGNSPFFKRYTVFAPYRPLTIHPTPVEGGLPGELDFNVLVDGNTNFLGFTQTDEKVFIVTDGVQATLENLILRNFSPKHLDLRPGAHVVFGDKTTMVFARDETLDQPFTFQGEATIKGGGNILDLSAGGELILQGANGCLILDGLILKGVTGSNIRCLDPSSKVILRNVKLIQSGDFTFATGGIVIEKDTNFVGPFNFTFSGNAPFMICRDSTLLLNRNKVFTYAPAGGNRMLFQFEDSSAALSLDQATFSAPAPGVQLIGGQLIVRNRNFLQNDGSLSQADGITLGNGFIEDNLLIDQPAGARLEQVSGFSDNLNINT